MKRSMAARRQALASCFPFHTRREFYVAKRAADVAVRNALAAGVLVRGECERCVRGSKRRAEAHHDDYSKPLDVRWLCRFHHRQRDKELRELRGLVPLQSERLLRASFPAVQRHEIARLKSRGSRLGNEVVQRMVQQATTAVFDAMHEVSVSEAQMARHLQISRQAVNNQLASGFRTLATLAVFADACGYEASVVLSRRQYVEVPA